MATYLKEGISVAEAQNQDARVREIVEEILARIGESGDAGLRAYSEQFDQWSPESFRLSREQIDACYAELDQQVIDDIRFAQEQVGNFARIQRQSMQDLSLIHI